MLKRLVQDGHVLEILVRNPAKPGLAEINLSQIEHVNLIQRNVFEPDKLKKTF